MKKIIKQATVSIFLAGFLMFAFCLPKVFAKESKNELTILFTHDLHENFIPFKAEQDGKVVNVGGYARLFSAIKAQKALDKDAVLVDGGDFSMGTPFQAIFQSDSPELRIMGEMGYDAVTLGNHEFDYRAQGLAECLNSAKSSEDKLPQMVQSNTTYPKDKEGNLTQSLQTLKLAMENYRVKDYTIIERKGIKIGIFGLMGEEAASMAPMSEVEFKKQKENAKRVVKILKNKEKADVIICLSHSGTEEQLSKSEDVKLAEAVPEINIIVSGHSHTMLEKPIIIKNTIIGSCEEYGKNLGVIKLKKENNSWKPDTYKLIPINDTIIEDADIAKSVSDYKGIVQKKYFDKFNLKYEQVVAKSTFNFPSVAEINNEHKESVLGNLISDAYIYTVKKSEGENYEPIAAAVVPAGTIRNTFFKGDITVADAFSTSSLGMGADKMSGYPIISIYLTGKELKTLCEVDASITPLMEEAQLFISGVNFTFNPHRLIFNKVVKCTLQNEDGSKSEIKDKKLYRVVGGLYSAQMMSVVGDKSYGIMSIVPKTKQGKPVADFEKQTLYDSVSKNELKEWNAVVSYLQSFDKVNGVSQIPEYYKKEQGRKVINNSRNILTLLRHPNQISIALYAIIFILVIGTGSVVYILKFRKKKKGSSEKTEVK